MVPPNQGLVNNSYHRLPSPRRPSERQNLTGAVAAWSPWSEKLPDVTRARNLAMTPPESLQHDTQLRPEFLSRVRSSRSRSVSLTPPRSQPETARSLESLFEVAAASHHRRAASAGPRVNSGRQNLHPQRDPILLGRAGCCEVTSPRPPTKSWQDSKTGSRASPL